MKNNILLVICLLFFHLLNAQSTFEFLRTNPADEISSSIIDDSENNIYFPVVNFQNALILKLDCNGTIIDSVQIPNAKGSCNLSELIRVNNEVFLALGEWSTDTSNQLWFISFNNNLEILLDLKLNSNDCHINDFRSIINHKGNIVFIAQYLNSEHFLNICIYELTPGGNVIRSIFYDYTSLNMGYTLLEDTSDYTYKLFSLTPVDSRSLSTLNTLDTNFNLIDVRTFYGFIDGHNSSKWFSNSSYLLTGERYFDSIEEMDIGILKVNLNDSVLSSTFIGKPDTVESPGQVKSLDFIDSNNIFFCGSTNSYGWPFQNDPSWIIVNILDSSLNIKSQQFYGGDAFYLVNSVLATQDGGCVISCSRYDYKIQYNEFDIYILKVNKDGLLVNIPDESSSTSLICKLHPNPGKGYFYIDSNTDNLKLELFDLTGNYCYSSMISYGVNLQLVSRLASGMYNYRILNQNDKLMQSGKWIKY